MTTLSITLNKIATIIETEIATVDGEVVENNKVFMIRKKSEFFAWAATQEAMNVRVSCNYKGFCKKMSELGFEIKADQKGCFEWEYQAYCSK